MAKTRRSHHRTSPTPSSSSKSKHHNTQTKHHSTSYSTDEETGKENPEEKTHKVVATLDLGTDDESQEEDEGNTQENGPWQRVTAKSRRNNGQQAPPVKVTEIKDPETKVSPPKIQIELDAVNEGIEYWSNAIFCYVLGANPPWTVLDGFARRIWKEKGIEQVSFLPNGIFLIRFSTKEGQQEALLNSTLIFDNKPVIVEEWTPVASLRKKEIKTVPIWVKLRQLELKFWGEKCFSKITSGIGKYLECDEATKHRQFLGFAKLKIEVQLDQQFPNTIEFLDEQGQEQLIGVTYDWLPVTCSLCNGIGHLKNDCRKAKKGDQGASKKTWVPKHPPPPKPGSPSKPKQAHIPPPTESGMEEQTNITNTIMTITRASGQKEKQDKEPDYLYQPGGISFLDKLSMSIKKDKLNQIETEAGQSLLYG